MTLHLFFLVLLECPLSHRDLAIQPQTCLVSINIFVQKQSLFYFNWKRSAIFWAKKNCWSGGGWKKKKGFLKPQIKTQWDQSYVSHKLFMCFPSKGCGWAVRREAICFPFAGDATTWPGKSIKKGEACAFLRITKHASKRKAFKVTCGTGREETWPGGRLQRGQKVPISHKQQKEGGWGLTVQSTVEASKGGDSLWNGLYTWKTPCQR